MTLGERIAAMRKLDVDIAKLEAEVRELKADRKLLEGRLLTKFEGEDIEGTKVRGLTVVVNKTQYPQIKNRGAVNAYILKTKNPDILQNRIMSKMYFDMLEEGDKIPGIEVFKRTSISITKRG